MIQFYDDRPGDPVAAFIYFEDIFRQQFLMAPLSNEGMKEYVQRLLIAQIELELCIFPSWDHGKLLDWNKFDHEVFLRFKRQFDDKVFLEFESEFLSIISTFKKILADPGAAKVTARAHYNGDFPMALRLLPLANRGDAVAQQLLGMMYARGLGVQKDYAEAEKWYRLSCIQGNPTAKKLLGSLYNHYAWLYEKGQAGHLKDPAQVVRWLLEAVKLDDLAAQNNLALKYKVGEGVPQDYVRAYVLFSLSTRDGDLLPIKNLDRLKKQMTPDQIDEGNRLLHEEGTIKGTTRPHSSSSS
jgi:hypothetical protein